MGCTSSKCTTPTVKLPTPREPTPREPTPREPTPALSSRESTDDDILKTSDFEGFNIDFERDSDEVNVEPTETNYPEPSPSLIYSQRVKTIQLFSECNPEFESNADVIQNEEPVTKAEIDSHAKQAPRSLLNSYDLLIDYLEKPVKGRSSRDEWLVRSILAWLSNQEVERYIKEEPHTDTPLGYLSLLGQKRSTYSTFFTVLCRKANIICAQIHGVCKAGDYQPGDRNVNELTCYWNAVYINRSWQIVHPYWVCRSVFGKKPGGWIKIEKSGQAIGKREIAAAGVIRNAFKDFYIMPEPTQFAYRCHPDDSKWQLIRNPITRDQFLDQSYLFLPIWGMGIKLVSTNLCTLEAKGGPVTISFELPKVIANEINLDYEFLLKENHSDKAEEKWMLSQTNIPRLVSKIRNGTRMDFYIQCPVKGIYKIVIFGAPEKQHFLRLCEFKINCVKPTGNCRLSPFDPGLLGFGPGPTSEKAGLLVPSHTNGLITTEKGSETKLNFLLDSQACHSLDLDAQLISPDNENGSASLDWTIANKNELRITIKITKDGDYGLKILTGKKQLDGSDVIMHVTCNYLVSSTSKFVFEKANKRVARRKLLASIESADLANNQMLVGSIETLKINIDKCIKEKIPETDSDILNAQKKLDILSIRKDIHDAYMRRHFITIQDTVKAIESSAYYRVFVESVQRLKNLAEQLNPPQN